MAKKKKGGGRLLVLLLLLVALIVAYIGYDLYEKKQENEKEAEANAEESIEVSTIEEADITSIYYKNDMAEVTLVKNSEDAWVNEAKPEVPLKSTTTNNIATKVESIIATKLINENAEDVAEYGLDSPSLTVTVTKTDGSKVTVLVGDESPLGDGNYICLEGSSTVYLVDTSFATVFESTENELTEVADAPSITAANITHLLLENQEQGNLEITYDTNNEYDFSDTGVAPYVINQGYDVPISGNTTNITDFFAQFTTLSYAQCVDYSGTDLAQYGLEDPYATLSIDYYEETETTSEGTDSDSEDTSTQTVRTDYSYNLLIGNLNDDESAYYVKVSDRNSVYTMTKSMVDVMFDYDLFGLTSKYVQLVNVLSVSEIDMLCNGENHTLTIDHSTTTDEDGNESNTQVFSLDGEEKEEETARDLFQAIISPLYDAAIPEGYSDADQPVVASFTFKRTSDNNEKDVVTEYKDYDDSFYTVSVNGVEKFLVDKRDLTDITDKLNDLMNME